MAMWVELTDDQRKNFNRATQLKAKGWAGKTISEEREEVILITELCVQLGLQWRLHHTPVPLGIKNAGFVQYEQMWEALWENIEDPS